MNYWLLKLMQVSEKEHVQLTEGTLDAIMKSSNGDMRKAVTFLQSAHQLCLGQTTISADMVIDISGQVNVLMIVFVMFKTSKQVPPSTMNKLWDKMAGYSFDAMKAEVAEIVYQGFPMSAILSQLHDDLISKQQLTDLDKALICEKIAEVQIVLKIIVVLIYVCSG